MNIEEIVKLRKRKCGKSGIEHDTCIVSTQELDELLNELNKNTEIISDLQNEVTIKDSEIELRDQVIWFMANRLTTEYHDIDWVTNYYYEEAKNYLEKSKTENN